MLWLIRKFWRAISAVLLFFGVFWLPADVRGYSEALEPWRKLLAMVDQLTAFKVLSGILVLWVIWIEVRPFILGFRASQKDPISLDDLAKLARSRYGWRFGNDSYESLDFIDALRQSGADGSLTILGRADCQHLSEDLKNYHPLEAIPREHFRRYSIDVPGFFEGTSNYNMSTHFPTRPNEGTYRDLHIQTKREATEWLREAAPKWRGKRESLEKKEKERRENEEAKWAKIDELQSLQLPANTETKELH